MTGLFAAFYAVPNWMLLALAVVLVVVVGGALLSGRKPPTD
jgi:hypothetical protein